MTFDARRIVSATGEDVVKVYDKTAPPQRTVEPPKPDRQPTREPVVHVR